MEESLDGAATASPSLVFKPSSLESSLSSSPISVSMLKVVCITPRFEGRDGWSTLVVLRAARRHQHTHGRSRVEYRVIHALVLHPGPFPARAPNLFCSLGMVMLCFTQMASRKV